jgi:hypothetical protein
MEVVQMSAGEESSGAIIGISSRTAASRDNKKIKVLRAHSWVLTPQKVLQPLFNNTTTPQVQQHNMIKKADERMQCGGAPFRSWMDALRLTRATRHAAGPARGTQ